MNGSVHVHFVQGVMITLAEPANTIQYKTYNAPYVTKMLFVGAAQVRVSPVNTPLRPTTNVRFNEHPPLSLPHSFPSTHWRRKDSLRGGAKMEIMSWGIHDGLLPGAATAR